MLKVEGISGTELRMWLSGSVRLVREQGDFPYRYEAQLLGRLVYDRAKASFQRFDVLAVGDWTWDYERKDAPQKDILGVALELWPGRFASPDYDRHFPGHSMSNYGYRQDREK